MAGTARRSHLLSVARTRFAEHGYRATTTSSIAVAAGVSESLLFKHFASKEELFRLSIVEPMLDLLRTRTADQTPSGNVAGHEAALRQFLGAWAALVRDERRLVLTLLSELNEFPDVAAEVAAMVRTHVAEVGKQIEVTTDRPEYRDFDPMVATWSGLAAATVAGVVADDPDAFVDEYVRILLHGVLR
jgi:AcrR family transcriptional regulator